jgi:hypothetical protein
LLFFRELASCFGFLTLRFFYRAVIPGMVEKTLDIVLDVFDQRAKNKMLTSLPDFGPFMCIYDESGLAGVKPAAAEPVAAVAVAAAAAAAAST